jgi:hypothetical protein
LRTVCSQRTRRILGLTSAREAPKIWLAVSIKQQAAN